MPRLFLHIGTHKTGTTSIQRFCAANRKVLREHGLWYPPTDWAPFSRHYAHHPVAHAIAGRHPDADASDAAAFFDHVRAEVRPNESVLISAEPMYRHQLLTTDVEQRTGKPTRAELSEAHTRYAGAVRQAIGAFDVTVLIMLRRQDLFLESLYAEHVLATGYERPIERFAKERGLLLDYRRRIDGWAEHFGSEHISVQVFDPANASTPVEQAFVEWTGTAWQTDFEIGPRHNVTLGRTFIEFKRLLNRQPHTTAFNNQLRAWIEELHAESDPAEIPDIGRYFLQPRDRVELIAQYQRGNQAIAREYLGRPKLFDDDLTELLGSYRDRSSLNRTQLQQLTQALLKVIAQDS